MSKCRICDEKTNKSKIVCDRCYDNLHRKYKKQFKKIGIEKKCVMCKKTEYIHLSNKSGYYIDDITDWEFLCCKCHMIKDKTLPFMNKIKSYNGGKILTTSIFSNKNIIKVQCNCGKIYNTQARYIIYYNSCQCFTCRKKQQHKHKLDKLRKLGNEIGWELLSTTFNGIENKHKWKCDKGHIIYMRPKHIKCGHRCIICGGTNKGTLEEIQQIAINNGGKCLSNKYVNDSTKLKFECAKGHRWETIPGLIKRGSWCRLCNWKNQYTK